MSSFFNISVVFSSAIVLRVVLLFFGIFQDKYAPLPYTDIDYYVFTDAARYVSQGLSPYVRETYRYTPLLAWILIPTAWQGTMWFSFGKILFAVADIITGWLLLLVLRLQHGKAMSTSLALKYTSIWLLNPMVATISTRGSSEGLLGVMVIALVWAVLSKRIALAGALLGLAVHFKIYPFIYGISILWYLEPPPPISISRSSQRKGKKKEEEEHPPPLLHRALTFLNPPRLTLLTISLATFLALTTLMYTLYAHPFLQHTYLHHLTRIDHRHSFSPYNTLLHLASFSSPPTSSTLRIERLAFLPQLLLSACLIPLALAKRDLPTCMLAQTFAFVAFNKVCTSQYFLWYLVLLPLYLPRSSLIREPVLGLGVAAAWVASQGVWLYFGWRLEFLGDSVFVPGLWLAGLGFLAVNCWVLGVVIRDVGAGDGGRGGRDGDVKVL